MIRKPRKRRPRFENFIDKDGNVVFDAGTYGDNAPPVEETPAPIGRPLDSTSLEYEDIDPLIDFYLSKPKRLTQALLIEIIQHVYVQKHGHSPAPSTLKERISYLRSRP
jgi:hypothetical protein